MHNNYLIILYKMKVHVVKDYVETEIPDVDVDNDDDAKAAVTKYLKDNNLKKKKGCDIKATRGFGASKNRYTIQVVDKDDASASAKSSARGKRSKKNNRKRSRHTRR